MWWSSKKKEEKVEKTTALNAYALLDNELHRLHGMFFFERNRGHDSDAKVTWARIEKYQELMEKLIVNGDRDIQERIAEMALLGDKGSKNV